MALSDSWWSTDYTDVRFVHDFSSASLTTHNYPGTNTDYHVIDDAEDVYTVPYLNDREFPGKETGMFYILVSSEKYAPISVDLDYLSRAIRLPLYENMAHDYIWLRKDVDTTEITILYVEGATSYDLYHIQPYCYGPSEPAAIIGCILRHLGLSTDYIDTDEFSNTHDGQLNDYPEPLTDPLKVFYAREVGEKLIDSLKHIVRHSWDLFGINIQNKITYSSRTRPTTYADLDKDAGIIGPIKWRYAWEHLVNKAFFRSDIFMARWGTGTFRGYAYDFEQSRDVYQKNLWEVEDTDSTTKYGEIYLGEETWEIKTSNEVFKVKGKHLPYLGSAGSQSVMYALSDDATYGRQNDSTLRREIVVRQDFRGLDFDVGAACTDVELTGDGDTIGEMCCWKKKINFDNMTVTSWLLENLL